MDTLLGARWSILLKKVLYPCSSEKLDLVGVPLPLLSLLHSHKPKAFAHPQWLLPEDLF